jgi:hypothetical protein
VTVEIKPLTLRGVLSVCERMRKSDWAEVINLLPRGANTPELIAMTCMQVSHFGFVAELDGVPTTVAQFVQILDGSWRCGLFSTDDFPKVWRPVVRELSTNVKHHLLDSGAVYCDAYADTLHPEAHRLLEHLGFRKVAILPQYGSRGRDIALFVATIGDFADVLRRRRG